MNWKFWTWLPPRKPTTGVRVNGLDIVTLERDELLLFLKEAGAPISNKGEITGKITCHVDYETLDTVYRWKP